MISVVGLGFGVWVCKGLYCSDICGLECTGFRVCLSPSPFAPPSSTALPPCDGGAGYKFGPGVARDIEGKQSQLSDVRHIINTMP